MRRATLWCLMNLLTLACLAQTNKFKDDILQKERERQFRVAHHIEKINIHFTRGADSLLALNKLSDRQLFFDKRGYLAKDFGYITKISKGFPKGEVVEYIINYGYKWDKRGNVVKMTISGEIENKKDVYTYEYDDNGRLTKEAADRNNQVFHYYDALGAIKEFTYDNRGNVTLQKNYGKDGGFKSVTEYLYNDQNQMSQSFIFTGIESRKAGREEFTYSQNADSLIKVEKRYNAGDALISQNESAYNKNGDQIAGYAITRGIKHQLFNYKYDDQNRVIESRGAVMFTGYAEFFKFENFGVDASAHFFYTYDAEGRLITVRRYVTDKVTGKEKLSAKHTMTYNN